MRMGSAAGLAFMLAFPLLGQFPQFPSGRTERNGQHYPDGSMGGDQGPNSPEKKRIQMLNADRQRTLVSDTQKLLKLAKELNDEVSQSETGMMTGGQLHKVEEIGKLAKSVKEKMSYSVGGFPSASPPLTIQPGIQ
jgi:hypothetical protein